MLTRVLSFTSNKPYRTKHVDDPTPFLDADGHVAFAENDIENPQNWSVARRVTISLSAILLALNAVFASSAPSGCLPSVSLEFGVSSDAAALVITLFLLGYCAGPLLFAPLSELYGRRWVFYASFTLYMAMTFLCAFAPNFGSLLVGRFLAGTLVSAPLSNSPGVLADVWKPRERAESMALFVTVVWIGPALGPVTGGFIQLTKGDWRWIFYVLLALGGVTWLVMLTIPETHAPTILVQRARRIRSAKLPGFETVQAPAEAAQNRSPKAVFVVALTRPWIILFDPISFFCAVYLAVVYMLLYMLFIIYPIVFQERRGWNPGVGELPLAGTIIGALAGGVIMVLDTRRRSRRMDRGELRVRHVQPEDNLPLAMYGGIGFAVSIFWFSWSAEYNSVPWIIPTIAGGFISTFMLLIFVTYLNYLVDVYLASAASAMAANIIARSACGAAAPLFTRRMFHALGVGPGGSLIGGLAALLAVVPFVFRRYGEGIRARSRFAPASLAEKQRRRGGLEDEEKEEGTRPAEAAVKASSEQRSDSDGVSNHTDGVVEKNRRDELINPASSTCAGSESKELWSASIAR
ncbi:hypothetical protein E4U43_004070 [Claviceps pusilla]|uniref:Major facilitator superfamily (MFS) profile domain-containing protein n=1 Tax=Claviceps pusilla TaxID=123648 RepID=A0A9P7SU66_9HYPO|nr:hypothetical protein E4U43_004070 [Claviceps pusilla]